MTDGEEFERLSVAQCLSLACMLEATAPKPGNVHRGADFEDLTYPDFLVAAQIVGPILSESRERGVGRAVYDAVAATRRWTGTNVNLGVALLLAPMAAAELDANGSIRAGLNQVLSALTSDDARWAFAAIRLAQPGGLGTVDEMDVSEPPPADLIAAMRSAASRDLVARQYAEGFATVLDFVVPSLLQSIDDGHSLTDSIIHTQMKLMGDYPDSLIERKCGAAIATASAARAKRVLEAGPCGSESYVRELAEFDFWLRSDGHRRNPGTTADLIAATLFVALREGRLSPPLR